MAQPMTQPMSVSVPVEHFRRVQEIETSRDMAPDEVTFFELVEAVSEYSRSEQEVIETVMYMLRSGHVQLSGDYSEPLAAKLCG